MAKFRYILGTFLLLFGATLPAETIAGRVVRIADGDTLVVQTSTSALTIRLHGIDAPEKAQSLGPDAKDFTSNVAWDRIVNLKVRDTDRYGRLVAEVLLPDGRTLNHELVRAGLAWWYSRYAPDDAMLKALEADARQHHRGLWSTSDPMPPWVWRKLNSLSQPQRASSKRSEPRSQRRSSR
jgi:micrococcal nuclease